jgi:hypothetical protein
MAVTLVADDLKEPTGELTADLFPGSDLDDLLAGWLTQAETLVEGNSAIATANHNTAAAAWVYHRAYGHVARRLAAAPSQVSVDGTVSKSSATDQRKYFADLAVEKLGVYTGYETEGDASLVAPAVPAFFGRARARVNG